MKEVIATKGMGYGKVSPKNSLLTMEPGDCWVIDKAAINIGSLRSAASRMSAPDRRFSVRVYTEKIVITRTI